MTYATTDTLRIQGSFTTQPTTSLASGHAQTTTPIDEAMTALNKLPVVYLLTADPAVSVSLGGLESVGYLFIKVRGGPVLVRLTTADFASQVVTVDDFLMLKSRRVPYTAISLQRDPGVETTVELFLGQLT